MCRALNHPRTQKKNRPCPARPFVSQRGYEREKTRAGALIAWIDDTYAHPLPEWTVEREAGGIAHCTCDDVRVLTIAPRRD
jgi:hypothetical protein